MYCKISQKYTNYDYAAVVVLRYQYCPHCPRVKYILLAICHIGTNPEVLPEEQLGTHSGRGGAPDKISS